MRSYVSQQSEDFIGKLGLEGTEEGLQYGDGKPTMQNLLAFMQSAAEVAAHKYRGASAQTQQEIQDTARRAKQEALREAGVTRVNTAVGEAAPVNTVVDINDPTVLLETAFRTKAKGGTARG